METITKLHKQSISKMGKGLNRQFSKEDTQMAKKANEIRSASLIIKEIQIKTTMRYHITALAVVVQLLSRVWLFVTPWTAARQASPPFTTSWSSLKLTSIGSVMPSNHLIFCCHLLLWTSIFDGYYQHTHTTPENNFWQGCGEIRTYVHCW